MEKLLYNNMWLVTKMFWKVHVNAWERDHECLFRPILGFFISYYQWFFSKKTIYKIYFMELFFTFYFGWIFQWSISMIRKKNSSAVHFNLFDLNWKIKLHLNIANWSFLALFLGVFPKLCVYFIHPLKQWFT